MAPKLASIFKANVVLDVYQTIAGRQRKGNLENPTRIADIVKDVLRKLNGLIPWAYEIKKLANKTNCSLPTRIERGEKRKDPPQNALQQTQPAGESGINAILNSSESAF